MYPFGEGRFIEIDLTFFWNLELMLIAWLALLCRLHMVWSNILIFGIKKGKIYINTIH